MLVDSGREADVTPDRLPSNRETRRRNSDRAAAYLTVTDVRRGLGTHQQGEGRHAFATDRPDFDLLAVPHSRDDRQNAIEREVDLFDRLFCFVNLLAQRELNQNTVFENARRGRTNKGAQNGIFLHCGRGGRPNGIAAFVSRQDKQPRWRHDLLADQPIAFCLLLVSFL